MPNPFFTIGHSDRRIDEFIDLFKLDLPVIDIRLGMNAAGHVTTPVPAAILPIWPIPPCWTKAGVRWTN